VALSLHRLDAYWNNIPIDRTHTTHLTPLALALAGRTEVPTSIAAGM
jgi:hypothetical protein